MDEEDDDFYDPADVVPPAQGQNTYQNDNPQADHVEEELEEEEEEEDDDDEFNIITEAPPDAAPADATHSRHATFRGESQQLPSADGSHVPKSATPQATSRGGARTPVTASATLAAPQKPGSEYPAIHTSTLDVNANPIHPTTGKPILSTDMDSDFPTDDKPWRRPGSDISDYFNYGFDEFTWASYVLKQQELRKEVGDQKKQMDEMQAFLGMPSMPGGPPPGPAPSNNAMQAMPTMPGMPDLSPDAMQSVFSTMMQQGLDPSSMDPVTFMQHAQAILGGQPGAGGGQQGQPGFGGQQGQGFGGQGGGQHQMGYGGYEQRGGYGGGRGRGRRW